MFEAIFGWTVENDQVLFLIGDDDTKATKELEQLLDVLQFEAKIIKTKKGPAIIGKGRSPYELYDEAGENLPMTLILNQQIRRSNNPIVVNY